MNTRGRGTSMPANKSIAGNAVNPKDRIASMAATAPAHAAGRVPPSI